MVEINGEGCAFCPLCKGDGKISGIKVGGISIITDDAWECPVCDGSGTIYVDVTLEVDLSDYGGRYE